MERSRRNQLVGGGRHHRTFTFEGPPGGRVRCATARSGRREGCHRRESTGSQPPSVASQQRGGGDEEKEGVARWWRPVVVARWIESRGKRDG